MKTTDKNEKSRNVLPFAVVQKAVEGDIVSINKVLKHYEGYISCLSVRKMYDEYGNEYYCVDETLLKSLLYSASNVILSYSGCPITKI